MAKTIQEQIAEMEARCSQLEELQKLFEKAVKNEFGMKPKKYTKSLKMAMTFQVIFVRKSQRILVLKPKKIIQIF